MLTLRDCITLTGCVSVKAISTHNSDCGCTFSPKDWSEAKALLRKVSQQQQAKLLENCETVDNVRNLVRAAMLTSARYAVSSFVNEDWMACRKVDHWVLKRMSVDPEDTQLVIKQWSNWARYILCGDVKPRPDLDTKSPGRVRLDPSREYVLEICVLFAGPAWSDLNFRLAWQSAVISDSVAIRLVTLSTLGRGLGLPSLQKQVKSVSDMIEHLKEEPTVRDSELNLDQWTELYFAAGDYLSRDLGAMADDSHFSLSLTSCFENTREEGGSAGYVREHYKEFSQDLTFLDLVKEAGECLDGPLYGPLGNLFWDPSLYTTSGSRSVDINSKFWEFAYTSRDEFLERPEGVSFGQQYHDGTSDRYYGVDSNIGYQITYWAFAELSNSDSAYVVTRGQACLFCGVPLFSSKNEAMDAFRLTTLRNPRSRLGVLMEPGLKARVFNTPERAAQIIGQLWRHKIESKLKRSAFFAQGEGPGLYSSQRKIKSVCDAHKGNVMFHSGDLTDASSLLHPKLCEAVLAGFIKDEDTAYFLQAWGDRSLGPEDLYPDSRLLKYQSISQQLDDTDAGFFTKKRGTLLGNAESFVFLSLSTAATALIGIAKSRFGALPPPDQLRNLLQSSPFYLKVLGDDFLVVAERRVQNHVNDSFMWTDQQLSDGKNYRSVRCAVFTEECGIYMASQFKVLGNLKLRLLSEVRAAASVAGTAQSKVVPTLAKASQVSKLLEYLRIEFSDDPFNGIYLQNIVEAYHTPQRKQLALSLIEAGCPIYLPQGLGGLGWPFDGPEALLEDLVPELFWNITLHLTDLVLKGNHESTVQGRAILRCLGATFNADPRTSSDYLDQLDGVIDFDEVIDWEEATNRLAVRAAERGIELPNLWLDNGVMSHRLVGRLVSIHLRDELSPYSLLVREFERLRAFEDLLIQHTDARIAYITPARYQNGIRRVLDHMQEEFPWVEGELPKATCILKSGFTNASTLSKQLWMPGFIGSDLVTKFTAGRATLKVELTREVLNEDSIS